MANPDLAARFHSASGTGALIARRNARLWLCLLLLSADCLALLIGFGVGARLSPASSSDMIGSLSAGILVFAIIAFHSQAYSMSCLTSATISCRAATLAFGATMLLFFLVIFASKAVGTFPRSGMLFGVFGSLGLLVVQRSLMAYAVRRCFGNQLFAEILILDGIARPNDCGAAAVIDARQIGLRPEEDDPHKLHQLGVLLRDYDRAIILCPAARRASWAEILKGSNVQGEVVVPEVGETAPLAVGTWLDTSTLVVSRGPLNLADRARKRLLDIALTVPLVIALLPLLLLVAIAIKIDSTGPVFFRQQRIGRGNRLFRIYKFRSMRTDCGDALGSRSTGRSDDRVTRIGRFIRSTSIDELPQLFNVLLGEMSLVGPRPHALGSTADNAYFWQVDRQYWHRHALKPGITGLAQIRGFRGATETRGDILRRIEADLEYLHGWSLARDVGILLRTFNVLVHHKAF
ncbi:sugar transferase [Sphingobium sp. BHU LFT2]|uniref:sugar transferase n=1 Tax=Sphingobium sp. BHU LFT2 TaxID=2807634 RepID=UPI0020364BEB|nr:sugar transferase [Sphingobium sp. BHU LFT2]